MAITLAWAADHPGAQVTYQPYPGAPVEHGQITGVNDTHVMVLYLGDRFAKATHPTNLTVKELTL